MTRYLPVASVTRFSFTVHPNAGGNFEPPPIGPYDIGTRSPPKFTTTLSIGDGPLTAATKLIVSPSTTFGCGLRIVTTIAESTAAVTLSAAALLFPSLVASMTTSPDANAVTTPSADTVAIAGELLVHVIARPLSGLPAKSVGSAASRSV